MAEKYEFSDTQNAQIAPLASKMRIVGYFLIALGVLGGIGSLAMAGTADIGVFVDAAVQVVIGVFTIQAAKSFQLIVDTQGNDMNNLMDALGELRKLYTIQFWLFMISLVIIALSILAVLYTRL